MLKNPSPAKKARLVKLTLGHLLHICGTGSTVLLTRLWIACVLIWLSEGVSNHWTGVWTGLEWNGME